MLDQTGCMYAPHVLGVMAGPEFDIKNSDPPTTTFIRAATTNHEFNQSQRPGSAPHHEELLRGRKS